MALRSGNGSGWVLKAQLVDPHMRSKKHLLRVEQLQFPHGYDKNEEDR